MRTGATDLWRVIGFAMPALPLSIVMFPSYTILPSFYAENTEVTLAFVGTALIIARIFDVVVDPVIGHFCDGTPRRLGGRKTWVLSGSVVLAVFGAFLYAPPATAGPMYYLIAMLGFYLGYSMIEISHKAMGTDLIRDYRGRSTIATALGTCFALGNLGFALMPVLSGEGKFNAATLEIVAYAIAILGPLTALIAIAAVPAALPDTGSRALSGTSFFAIAHKNYPLKHFLGSYLLVGLGQGVFYGLVYLYVTKVLQLDDHFVFVLLTDAVVTLFAVPIWRQLVVMLQKHRALALGVIVSSMSICGMWFVDAGAGSAELLLFLIALRAFGAAVLYVAPNALIGDIVDYEWLRRGANRAANCHALVTVFTKMGATVGGGAGLILLDLVGFEAQGVNDEAVDQAFRVIALAVPAVLLLGGALMAFTFPLDRRAHGVVLRRLERRGHA